MNDILIDGVIVDALSLKQKDKGISWTSFMLKNTMKTKAGKIRYLDIRCVAFDKCAMAICHSFKQGDGIFIRGKLNPKKFTREDGTEKEGMEIMVRSFENPKDMYLQNG